MSWAELSWVELSWALGYWTESSWLSWASGYWTESSWTEWVEFELSLSWVKVEFELSLNWVWVEFGFSFELSWSWVCVELSQVELSRIEMSGVDLIWVELCWVELSWAELNCAECELVSCGDYQGVRERGEAQHPLLQSFHLHLQGKGSVPGIGIRGLVFIWDGILKLAMVVELFDSVNWSQLILHAYKCDSFVCSLLSWLLHLH
jgi:hypothetical protein